MRFGMTVIGIVLLTGTVTFGQTASDMATLERKLPDAQAAFARVEPTGVALGAEELRTSWRICASRPAAAKRSRSASVATWAIASIV